MKVYFLFLLLALTGLAPAQVKVASLHPLMGDLARQVGGFTDPAGFEGNGWMPGRFCFWQRA